MSATASLSASSSVRPPTSRSVAPRTPTGNLRNPNAGFAYSAGAPLVLFTPPRRGHHAMTNSYLCFSARHSRPMARMKSEPKSTGYTTYQNPRDCMAALSTAAKTHAAPGGCTLPVHIMNASATEMPSARAMGVGPMKCISAAAMNVDATVPTTQLYTRAAGLSRVPKARTEMVAHAPWRKGRPRVTWTRASTRVRMARVRKQSRNPQKMSEVGRFCTSGLPFRLGRDMRE